VLGLFRVAQQILRRDDDLRVEPGSDRLDVNGSNAAGTQVRCYMCIRTSTVPGIILGEVDFLAGANARVDASWSGLSRRRGPNWCARTCSRELLQQRQGVRVDQGHRLHGRISGLKHGRSELGVDGVVRQHGIALRVEVSVNRRELSLVEFLHVWLAVDEELLQCGGLETGRTWRHHARNRRRSRDRHCQLCVWLFALAKLPQSGVARDRSCIIRFHTIGSLCDSSIASVQRA
jgi:hypothetical protein